MFWRSVKKVVELSQRILMYVAVPAFFELGGLFLFFSTCLPGFVDHTYFGVPLFLSSTVTMRSFWRSLGWVFNFHSPFPSRLVLGEYGSFDVASLTFLTSHTPDSFFGEVTGACLGGCWDCFWLAQLLSQSVYCISKHKFRYFFMCFRRSLLPLSGYARIEYQDSCFQRFNTWL